MVVELCCLRRKKAEWKACPTTSPPSTSDVVEKLFDLRRSASSKERMKRRILTVVYFCCRALLLWRKEEAGWKACPTSQPTSHPPRSGKQDSQRNLKGPRVMLADRTRSRVQRKSVFRGHRAHWSISVGTRRKTNQTREVYDSPKPLPLPCGRFVAVQGPSWISGGYKAKRQCLRPTGLG